MTQAQGFSPVRFMTLLMKEFRQMVCDPATLFLGTILPVILILLFGWGLSKANRRPSRGRSPRNSSGAAISTSRPS